MTLLAMHANAPHHLGLEVLAHHVTVPETAVRGDVGLEAAADPRARALDRALDVEQVHAVAEIEIKRAQHVATADLAALSQELHVERTGVLREQRAVDEAIRNGRLREPRVRRRRSSC